MGKSFPPPETAAGQQCGAVLATVALLHAWLRWGGVSLQRAHEKPPASKRKNTGAKAWSKSQGARISLQLPRKQGMKMRSQQPLLCSSTREPSRCHPQTSTCRPHTSTCVGVII